MILFLQGIPDDNKILSSIDNNGNIRIHIPGSANLLDHIKNDFEYQILNFAPIDSRTSISVDIPTLVINQISEPDTHIITLNKANQLIEQLGITCINKPLNILDTSRDKLFKYNSDLTVVPKTIRVLAMSSLDISKNIKKYPVIVRLVGNHGGQNTWLIKKPKELEVLKNLSYNKLYDISEFIDYGTTEYIKYRFAIIDGVPYIRHVLFSNHWMVHASARKSMTTEQTNKEREIIELYNSNHESIIHFKEELSRIGKLSGLEYIGIDCHISNKILVFEINANMNILIQPETNTNECNNIKQALINLIRGKL